MLSVNSAEPVRNYLFLIQFFKTILILIHDHLVDFRQEYGFQWSVVPVEECRFFVSERAFARLLIVMHEHKCRRTRNLGGWSNYARMSNEKSEKLLKFPIALSGKLPECSKFLLN